MDNNTGILLIGRGEGDDATYRSGLDALAAQLRPFLGSSPLEAAVEGDPSGISAAAQHLVKKGCVRVLLTPVEPVRAAAAGNALSESAKKLGTAFPGVRFECAWPYDVQHVAELIARNLRNF
jgi:hypothetical protein